MKLAPLIMSAEPIEAISSYLDALSPAERLRCVQQLSKREQRVLYVRAEAAPPLSLDDFAPAHTTLQEVIHDGRNSLPIFSLFQKRFCRANDGSGRVFGYNQGATTAWIGPGYFIAKSTADHPVWRARGSVIIDYYEVPAADVVPSWPKIIPNDSGLQRLVYYKMRDFMRRVSTHVSVGIAYQNGKSLGQYFVLCRAPEARI